METASKRRPGRPPARPERQEQRQDQILDAVEQVVAQVGLAACTMDQVARAADMSRPLLYVYYRDMQALTQAVAARALTQLESRFERAVSSESLGLRKVLAIAQSYVDFAREEPERFAVLSLCEAQPPEADGDPQQWQAMMQVGGRLHALTEQALRDGIEDGSIRPDLVNLDVLSKTLWAFVHGVIQLMQTKRAVIEYDGHSMDVFFQVSMEFAMQALVRRN